jgi:hypothetical protein
MNLGTSLGGHGESASTLVLMVKTQILEIVYFWKIWKIDTKFGFKSIELARWNSIFNQQGQKIPPIFVYIPSSIS